MKLINKGTDMHLQHFLKLQRLEIMKRRLKKPRDMHLEQMQIHQTWLADHTRRTEGYALRQTNSLEKLCDIFEEQLIHNQSKE
jgi:hypothetical protein